MPWINHHNLRKHGLTGQQASRARALGGHGAWCLAPWSQRVSEPRNHPILPQTTTVARASRQRVRGGDERARHPLHCVCGIVKSLPNVGWVGRVGGVRAGHAARCEHSRRLLEPGVERGAPVSLRREHSIGTLISLARLAPEAEQLLAQLARRSLRLLKERLQARDVAFRRTRLALCSRQSALEARRCRLEAPSLCIAAASSPEVNSRRRYLSILECGRGTV